MNIKKIAKDQIFIFCIFSSSLFSEKINQFQITPNKITKNQAIELIIPNDPPSELSIITPNNEMIYVEEFFRKKGYPSKKNIKFNSSEVYGYKYIDGQQKLTKVFKQTGKYKFYFADNLETETENTHSISLMIIYKNK